MIEFGEILSSENFGCMISGILVVILFVSWVIHYTHNIIAGNFKGENFHEFRGLMAT